MTSAQMRELAQRLNSDGYENTGLDDEKAAQALNAAADLVDAVLRHESGRRSSTSLWRIDNALTAIEEIE